jgi:[acyl-carrier-protein] S-malonyltransferase
LSDLVAVVAGRPISMAQLERRIAELARSPRGRHIAPANTGASGIRVWILREMVDDAILVEEARAAGIIGRSARTVTTGDVARLVEFVTDGVVVGDAEVRDYFERNRDLFRRPATRTVRLATCSSGAAVRTIDLDEVAPLTIRRGELVGALEDAIFGAAVGTLVGPIETDIGWHTARVDEGSVESTLPFAAVRREIEAELVRAARLVAFDEWLGGRRRALARLTPGFDHPGSPGHGSSSHRH